MARYSNMLEDYCPCAGVFFAVNAIGTQLRDPIHSGLIRWWLAVSVDTVIYRGKREEGERSARKHEIQPCVENERTDAGRDGRTCLARSNYLTQTGTGK